MIEPVMMVGFLFKNNLDLQKLEYTYIYIYMYVCMYDCD
jgi:hypothetical protein